MCSVRIALVSSCQDTEISNSVPKGNLISLHVSATDAACLAWFFGQSWAGEYYTDFCSFLRVEKCTSAAVKQTLHSQRCFVKKERAQSGMERLSKDENLALCMLCTDCLACFFHFLWKFLEFRDVCWKFLLKLVKLLEKRFSEQKSVVFSLSALP